MMESIVDKYKKLEKQPLKFVLAEFRFSQIQQIGEYIPRIQEALRKSYPLPDKSNEQNIQVDPNGISVSTSESWLFRSANKKSVIGINQDRLVFYTSNYSRFEQFEESCKQALEILTEIVEPTLILRIGLRFSDLVVVEENEVISQLVDPNFSFPKSVSSLGENVHHRCETILSNDSGILAIRTLYGINNMICLQDIREIPVLIEKEEKNPSERMILDFDHFWESKETTDEFKTDNILKILNNMHKSSRKAFWEITSDYARNEKWA
jgi:uncharacterized protein (TIGR04255 family)